MLAAKIPQRTICEQLHMTRGVLNRYKTLADSQGLSYGVIGRMNDGEIEYFLQLSKPTAAPSSQRQVLDGLLPPSNRANEKGLSSRWRHNFFTSTKVTDYKGLSTRL